MYQEAKRYLIEKVKESGLKTKPHTTQKSLERSQESHVGAVLFESETIVRNGSKKLFEDQTGARKKRRKIFDRGTSFTVILGDYDDETVETMFESFLSSIDSGITVDGNFVPIEVEGADWVDSDDSILKAKVAVQIKIRFNGGVYKDTDFAKVRELSIESVEKNGKESTNGNEKGRNGQGDL